MFPCVFFGPNGQSQFALHSLWGRIGGDVFPQSSLTLLQCGESSMCMFQPHTCT